MEPEVKRTTVLYEEPFSLGLWNSWVFIFQYSCARSVLCEYFQAEEVFSMYDVLPYEVT